MPDAKHTPGPWDADLLDIRDWTFDIPVVRQADYGWRICAVSGTNRQVGEANARLIAAAPELYEALEDILILVDHDALPFDLLTRIRAVVAKASGDPQIGR